MTVSLSDLLAVAKRNHGNPVQALLDLLGDVDEQIRMALEQEPAIISISCCEVFQNAASATLAGAGLIARGKTKQRT